MADVTLRTALAELVRAASAHGVTIFLCGGYGLYLKQVHVASTQERTLIQLKRGHDLERLPISTSSCRRRSSSISNR
jgi:hypothetical protein